MFDADHHRVIEGANRFRYPSAFWERRQELASLAETAWFRATYPGARLIGTHDEVWAARRADPDLPDDLIPFLIVGGQQFPDYYGFQVPRRPVAGAAELPVLVWCIHAYVHGWDAGFGAFLDELQSQHAEQRHAEPGAAADGAARYVSGTHSSPGAAPLLSCVVRPPPPCG